MINIYVQRIFSSKFTWSNIYLYKSSGVSRIFSSGGGLNFFNVLGGLGSWGHIHKGKNCLTPSKIFCSWGITDKKRWAENLIIFKVETCFGVFPAFLMLFKSWSEEYYFELHQSMFRKGITPPLIWFIEGICPNAPTLESALYTRVSWTLIHVLYSVYACVLNPNTCIVFCIRLCPEP